ncbi:MAG: 16S rRNA (cytidine(1402)-2'-O)-methyltransferase [Calditrichaeota bacterium]|nr:MAG: 16S rRNA (cytidine(1402)-2'-O)-methyltransferase [Calditrichota bacterium]MBL1208081.1 16S rRNA (cytidine(1402)-2'-O)-methyltransferase [Calditrichota bacterium]NOG47919.1 16S rRNA (cytidine(1402)-2'-O)-methyltransferase [Calditrichota bacterium]
MVATPIGNLSDISYRAVHILKSVDLIAAEDTRTSSVLMNHYLIKTPLKSYHSHNIPTQTPRLIEKLKAGESIALISDAGTPGISDPGYNLVCACVENGIRVIPIPGASAFISALISSGLPTQRFVFEGFLPHKKGRKTRIESLIDETRTMVFYESPHRIHKTLDQLAEAFGDRKCVLAREISKKFEEFISGTFAELIESVKDKKVKGELVLVVEGNTKKPLRIKNY